MELPNQRIFNKSIERVILSSLIFQPEFIEDFSSEVFPDDFYIPFHRDVYSAILKLQNKIVSEEEVQIELEKSSKFKEDDFLYIFLERPVAKLDFYIKELKNKSTKRRLLLVAKEIEEAIFEQDMEAEDLLNLVEEKVYAIGQESTTGGFKDIHMALQETEEYLQKAKERENKTVTGIDTGFRDLNTMTTGFNDGDLIIIAARPSMGKTAIALNFVYNAISTGKGVAFFSLEMPVEQLMLRLFSIDTRIHLQDLRTGDLEDKDLNSLDVSMNRFRGFKLFIDDDGNLNIHQLRTKLRKLKAKNPDISLAVVDYIQIMNSKASKDRHIEVSDISRGLKLLARELKIPIIALSQLNRSLETRNDKRPIMSDIRESGCLTGDSLVINSETGERIRIDEVVKNRDKLLPFKTRAMGENLKMGDFDVINAFSSGVRKVYKMTLKSGKSIKATANHKFYRVDGWIPLGEMKLGDKIATPDSLEIEPKENALSNSELILLAHLLGSPKQPYHYTSEDFENIEIVREKAKELFDIEGKVIQQENWWHISFEDGSPLTIWYEKLGISSDKKRVPEAVFRGNTKSIELFLHHLWATNGLIARHGVSMKVYYSSNSYKFAEAVQSLLLRAGIVSSIRIVKQEKQGKEYGPNYRVSVQGKNDIEKFLKRVNSYGELGKKRDKFLDYLSGIKAKSINSSIHKIVWEQIDEALKNSAISLKEFSKKTQIYRNKFFKINISIAQMKSIASVLKDEKLSNIANSDIYWDEIVSIEELGEEEVFDITVDKAHCFVSQNMIPKNSIEQDADIIFFVYRDDVYRLKAEKEREKEARDKGEKYEPKVEQKPEETAEIIIGKQRNGPTGVVKLNFQKNFTKFVDFTEEHISDKVEKATKFVGTPDRVEIPDDGNIGNI